MSTELQETQDEGFISDEQAEIYNRQACNMVCMFFRELATFSADDIYDIASKGQDADSQLLLEKINNVYKRFLENGEGLPTVYFDSYARTVDSMVHTFKLNIESKLELNSKVLIAQVVGKDEVSYTDIANAIIVLPEKEEEAPVE